MPLSDFIARLFDANRSEETIREADEDKRLGLLEMSRQGAERRPVPKVLDMANPEIEAEAQAFVRAAGRRYGITGLGWDMASIERIDELLDTVRMIEPAAFEHHMRHKAAAWVSEWMRHVHGLGHTSRGTVTDGRVEFDALSKIEARIVSDEAPTLLQSIRSSLAAMEIHARSAA